MFNGRRVLALCPARGGSKGIPLKNLVRIGDATLIEHVARVTRLCPFIDETVISTDHPLIAAEAQRVGSSVPFLRPDSLSGDHIGDVPVLQHGLRSSEAFFDVTFDIVLMLQPTSPLRKAEHIQQIVEHMVLGGFDSVWTVSRTDVKYHPLKQLTFDGHKLDFFDTRGEAVITRQSLGQVYHRNGIGYALTRECLLDAGKLMTANSSAVVIDDPHVNIDTLEDVERARDLIRRESGYDV